MRVAAALLRHVDGACRLAAALSLSRTGWAVPGRAAFVVHRRALRSAPLALYAELYSLAVSPEIELEPFRTVPPCSTRCNDLRTHGLRRAARTAGNADPRRLAAGDELLQCAE